MGAEKAFLVIAGKPLLRHVLDRLGQPALISANDDRYLAFGQVVRDLFPAHGPLAGIHALLLASATDRLFVCGCDMPFISLPLITHLMEKEGDFILPIAPDGEQPLHAVYSRSCLPAIERRLREGRLKTTDFQDLIRTVRVPVDPADWRVEGRSPFLNVNTPEDLADLSR